MKAYRKFSRSFVLCFLCFSVFGPIIFLFDRLKNINYSVSKDFIEDLSIIKHRTEAQTLSAIEQEDNEDLKVPPMVVYKDETSNSSVNFSFNKDVNFGEVRAAATDKGAPEIKVTRHDGSNDSQTKWKKYGMHLPRSEEKSNPNDLVVHNRSRGALDEKVKEMKDQVLRARVYLSFAVPNGNSHLVRELKVRMRDVERGMNHCTRDSHVSRSALQKMAAMESTLSKAHRIYPDCSAIVKKLRAMTFNAEEQVESQRKQESFLRAVGGRTIPKGLHCLSMRLTAEYFALAPQKRELPYNHKMRDPRLYHFAVFSDNVLACSVVVKSTISTAREPERVVFHIVTDSLNFPAMSMWFLSNPPERGTVHVESIEHFQWLSTKYGAILQREGSIDPRYACKLNYLRFYMADIFPHLNKVVLLDHDVVVQRDLTKLWNINMRGKVNGAVQTCNKGDPSSFRRMDMFINFTDPIIIGANALLDMRRRGACTWAFGMNVFDLKEWRRRDLTKTYHKYLHLGGSRSLWKSGSLPIGWLTFYGQTVALDKHWHVLGLGYDDSSGVGVKKQQEDIDRAAVLHFDGAQKPWLDIGLHKYKYLWKKYVKYEHPYLQDCNVHD